MLDFVALARHSLYVKLNWWLDHFMDRQFEVWRRHIHTAVSLTIVDFAALAGRRGVTDPDNLVRELRGWITGRDPNAYRLHELCHVWSVPVQDWLLNHDRLPCDLWPLRRIHGDGETTTQHRPRTHR